MKQLSFLVCVAAIATSCTHAYYSPNTPNTPLLSQKGEVRVNALYSEGGVTEFAGGEGQVAVAITDHVGMMLNGMTVSKSETTDYNNTKIEKGSGSYIEFAGGLFRNFDGNKKWIGEIYGGAGFGSSKNDYSGNQYSKVVFSKLFLQPAFGFKSKYFEFAFTPRLSWVNWKVKEDNLMPGDYDKEGLNTIRTTKRFFCFEPSVTLKGGWKGIKIQLSSTFSNPGGNQQIVDIMETAVASMGVSIDIFSAKKK